MTVCRILFNAYQHVFATKSSANGVVGMWPYIESVKGKNYKEFPFCLSRMISECGAMRGLALIYISNIRYFGGCEYSCCSVLCCDAVNSGVWISTLVRNIIWR
jgi:hypothetical protein